MINNTEQLDTLLTNKKSVNYGTNTIEMHPQALNNLSVQSITKDISFLFGKILQFVYITTIIVIIIGFLFIFGFEKFQKEFVIATMTAITFSCFCTCYGLIKFGTIQSKISDIKLLNNTSANEIKTLRNTKHILKNEISELEAEKHQFNQRLIELQKEETKYSQIISVLETVSKEEEHIMDVVDYMNETLERMLWLIHLNHRAYLLLQFYEVLRYSNMQLIPVIMD
eukprot:249318_1